MDKRTRIVICAAFGEGKCHDFKLFKESRTHIHPEILVELDTGYIGIKKIHANSSLPKKK